MVTLRKAFSPGKAGGFVAPAILLVLLLFFYTNGALYFGDLWISFQPIILLYTVLLVAAFALAPKLLTTDPKAPIYLEFIAYIGPAVLINILILIAGVRNPLGPPGDYLPIVGLQIAISGTEEAFFRGALWHRFHEAKAGLAFGPIVSSALFAGFHAYVYGLNIFTIVLAFIAGFTFWLIYDTTRDRFGLAVNSGVHLGYNLALLGVSLIPLLPFF